MAVSYPLVELKSEFSCMCTHLPPVLIKGNVCVFAVVADLQCSATIKTNCQSRYVCAIVVCFFFLFGVLNCLIL
jgi:hypothetical protein